MAEILVCWTPIECSMFKPRLGHWAVFLGKTLYSYSVSLHPSVYKGPSEFIARGNPAMD